MFSSRVLCFSVVVLALALCYYNKSSTSDWHGVYDLVRKIPVIGPIIIDSAKAAFHPEASATSSPAAGEDKLFTADELKAYAGDKGLHLSILGLVFDVEKGQRFYAKGRTYHGFTGRDATRSFVTGVFTEDGLRDDVLDLKPSEILSLDKWSKTYAKDYTYKGKLIGRYYDENGQPTEYNKAYLEALANARKLESQSEDVKKLYPPCDSQYVRGKGGKVYCSLTSGGVKRDWVGFPRQLFIPDTGNVRCACVHESRLGEPNLSEYPGCSKDSNECKTSDN